MARLDNVLYLVGMRMQNVSVGEALTEPVINQFVSEAYEIHKKLEEREQSIAAQEAASYNQNQMELARQRAMNGGDIPVSNEDTGEEGLGDLTSYDEDEDE